MVDNLYNLNGTLIDLDKIATIGEVEEYRNELPHSNYTCSLYFNMKMMFMNTTNDFNYTYPSYFSLREHWENSTSAIEENREDYIEWYKDTKVKINNIREGLIQAKIKRGNITRIDNLQ